MSVSVSETVVSRQRPTSQFVSVEDTSHGGGSAPKFLSAVARSSPLRIERRPVSSVYSTPSDQHPARNSSAMLQAGYDNRASSIYPPTISPPDSPRTNDADDLSSQPNISPISTAAPAQPWLRASNIPVPRHRAPVESSPSPAPETRSGWRDVVKTMGRSPSPSKQQQREQNLAQSTADQGEPTRWDTYSGEKSANGSGKPGAASPTQHPYTGTDPGFGYSAEVTSSGNSKPSHFLGVKLRKASDRPAVPAKSQEPWKSAAGLKGPGGRSASVEPILSNNPTGEKKHYPTPAERRARGLFQKQATSGRTSPGPSVGLGIRSGTPTGRQTPQNEERERPHGGLRVFTGALESVREAASNMMQYREKSPDPPRPTTSVPDGPNGEVVVNQTMRYKYRLGDSSSREQSPMTPTYDRHIQQYPGLTQQSSEGLLRNAYLNHQGRSFTAPVSESPATYGTSNNVYHLPPRKDSRLPNGTSSSDDFDAHQITAAFHTMGFDNQPKSHFSATTYNTSVADSSPPETPHIPGTADVPPLPTPPQEISILNRKRPVPSTSNQFRAKPNRKPTPGGGTGSGDDMDSPAAPIEPPEPPKPVDRIKELEDRLRALNKRKISLAQMIHELTNVVHPSSVHYDIASREEIKKSVNRMKTEQDVVLAEIQELGIKLHRAVRKRDEMDGGGGAGLWVRRVTE